MDVKYSCIPLQARSAAGQPSSLWNQFQTKKKKVTRRDGLIPA